MKRICRCCGCWFTARANVANQQYCSRRICQNARRQRWRKQKLLTDPDYKADQYAAQKRWCEKNPDYWKHYRDCHPDCEGKEIRIKADALLAQALEHEIDHTNGVLFIDHLASPDDLHKVEPGKEEEGEENEGAGEKKAVSGK